MGTNSTIIKVNSVNVRCFFAGDGADTILLLHGAGVDSAMMSWAEVIKLLAPKYRVIAPDLPGYGGSDRIRGEYSLDFYTEIVEGVITEFNCAPVILAGLSLGGGISINLALRTPEYIKILIPVDAWGLFTKPPYHPLTYWYTRSKLNEKSYKWTGKSPTLVRWLLKTSLIGDKTKITEELVKEIQRLLLEPDASQPFISFQRSEITKTGLKTDLFNQLGNISIPTLLIHGSEDKVVPVKDAIAASRIISNCELYLMEGCKHWPQKKRPEEFARVVNEFIVRHNI